MTRSLFIIMDLDEVQFQKPVGIEAASILG